MNASLISGLNDPMFIAVSGGNLFVTNGVGNTVGEYTMTGATVNASLISGFIQPHGSRCLDRICSSRTEEPPPMDTAARLANTRPRAATVNASLISGLFDPTWNRGISRESVCCEP